MQLYHRFGNVCMQQLKEAPLSQQQKNHWKSFQRYSVYERIKLGKNLELLRGIAFRIGGKRDTGHEAETVGEMPRKVGNLIPLSPSRKSFSIPTESLASCPTEMCSLLALGFAEGHAAAMT